MKHEIRDNNGLVKGEWDDGLDEFETLTEVREVTCGSLSVVVDYNELLADKGEKETYRLIAELKDLLT